MDRNRAGYIWNLVDNLGKMVVHHSQKNNLEIDLDTEKDTYKTILKPSLEVLYKEKGSKFYGYAFPIFKEEDVKEHIEMLKKQHHSARHWCYAWQLGKE